MTAPLKPFFKPLVKDWVEEDDKFIGETGYLGIRSYTTTFAQDEEAILSLVRSVEEVSQDMAEDQHNRTRLREMYSYAGQAHPDFHRKRNLYPPSDFDEGAFPESEWPSALVGNVAEALCMQDTVAFTEKPTAFAARYCELLLKIFNAYKPEENKVFGMLANGLGYTLPSLRLALAYIQDDVRDELYMQITKHTYCTFVEISNEGRYPSGVDGYRGTFKLLKHWIEILTRRHDRRRIYSEALVDNLNRQLQEAITDSTVTEVYSRAMAANVIWYLERWCFHMSEDNYFRDDNPYSSGETYRALASAAWTELQKHKGLRDELGADDNLLTFMEALEKWLGSTDANPDWRELEYDPWDYLRQISWLLN